MTKEEFKQKWLEASRDLLGKQPSEEEIAEFEAYYTDQNVQALFGHEDVEFGTRQQPNSQPELMIKEKHPLVWDMWS